MLVVALVSCAGAPAPSDAPPSASTDVAASLPPPPPALPAQEPAPEVTPLTPTLVVPTVETSSGLASYRDLSKGEVWAYVREADAKRLARDESQLLAAPKFGKPGAFTIHDGRDDAERSRESGDAFRTLAYHQGFARERMVWPDLAGAVLQREEGAFVAVRITLAEDTLVLDLDQRDVRTLSGTPVSIDVATASPERVGLLHFRSGTLRAYALVNAATVRRLEVGGDAIRTAYDDELARLRRAVQRLDAADPIAVVRILETLQTAFAEIPPGRLMRIEDRLEALERLRDFAVEPWARDVHAAPFRLGAATSPRVAACRRVFHPGRKLAPGEWCGTGAMPYHDCSNGCAMAANGTCYPTAESY